MVTVLEFHGHSENDAFVAVIAIRNRDITRGQMRRIRREGDHNHVFGNYKLLH
jgi:hypothetical protein